MTANKKGARGQTGAPRRTATATTTTCPNATAVATRAQRPARRPSGRVLLEKWHQCRSIATVARRHGLSEEECFAIMVDRLLREAALLRRREGGGGSL